MLKNYVIISDLHCGCQLGLCPPGGARLDEGGRYLPNAIQKKIWLYWREFWEKFVPQVTKNQPWGLVINGDAIDGIHHGATTQISHNLADQRRLAIDVLGPVAMRAKAVYLIRGTEAHVGKSATEEEAIAAELGAVPNEHGQRARYDLWLKIGDGLAHVMHHIGATGSQAYEATAVHKELTEEYTEAGRWGERPPDIVVRSHRHRFIKSEIASDHGNAQSVVTPGWQAKTPFAWKIAGARLSAPQFGGIVLRQGDEDLFVRHRVWTIGRSKVEG